MTVKREASVCAQSTGPLRPRRGTTFGTTFLTRPARRRGRPRSARGSPIGTHGRTRVVRSCLRVQAVSPMRRPTSSTWQSPRRRSWRSRGKLVRSARARGVAMTCPGALLTPATAAYARDGSPSRSVFDGLTPLSVSVISDSSSPTSRSACRATYTVRRTVPSGTLPERRAGVWAGCGVGEMSCVASGVANGGFVRLRGRWG